MKTCLKNCWAWMFIAIAIAVPAVASAQSICEGLTTILTADDDELEFYTVPGAICKYDHVRNKFGCIWQKPRPHNTIDNKQWLRSVTPDMKKLAGAIQQCIKQEAIPFEWDSLEKQETPNKGITFGYFVQRVDGRSSRRGLDTISVCVETGSFYSTEAGRYITDPDRSGVVLTVGKEPEGKSYCTIFWNRE